MATLSNTTQTYALKGIREDLRNQIYNISPEETPFLAMIGKSEASSSKHEWQTDALAAPAENAQVEGDEFANDPVTPTVRVGNWNQISRKVVSVTRTANAVKKAGRRDELVYQVDKKTAELKRDMERAFVGANTASLAGTASTAAKLGSLQSWLTTNDYRGSGGSEGGYNVSTGLTVAATDGTPRSFTLTLLQDAQQSAYTAGGNPNILMMHPSQKRVFSAFSGIAQLRKDVDKGKQAQIVSGADAYVGDFGTMMVVSNRFQRSRDVFLLDPDMLEMAVLDPLKIVPIAKTGDAERKAIIVEYTLVVKNEAAHAIIADLS